MNIPINEVKSITITNSQLVAERMATAVNLIKASGRPMGIFTAAYEHEGQTIEITNLYGTNKKGELGFALASLRSQIKFITLKKMLDEKNA